jgi:L-alanine-DL-glutamate epimerase-like enolase superfamily enzyme
MKDTDKASNALPSERSIESTGKMDRRGFTRTAFLGGVSLSALLGLSVEDTLAQATSKVNRNSRPSSLKITDLRYVLVEHLGRRVPILRIDTNQDIYGLGEVRDGGHERSALLLKSKILGQNPCNVERLFKNLKEYGDHGRQGGGVSGIEMALWDLAGKAYDVPVYQLLGGKYRNKVRLYADTHGDTDFELIKRKVGKRIKEEGYTWLKMTRCFNVIKDDPDNYVNGRSKELTDRGIQGIADYLSAVREFVGPNIAISADHFGTRTDNDAIRLGRALGPAGLAWMEEPVSWTKADQLKLVKEAVETPIATGENMFGRESFQFLCDNGSIDIVHPDMATAGGILETKKIADYAQDKGVGAALHYAGSPVSFMANVHCAAATENISVLEYHPENEEIPEWNSMARLVTGQPFISNGYGNVPDAPGLGLELDMDGIKKVLHPADTRIFPPTTDWDV